MNRSYKNLIFLLLVASAVLFFRLGDRSLRNPDEGRYAEIAREMVVSGDWLRPTLFGIEYLKKPPLFHWLLASSFKIFGVGEWAARAVPAFFGLLTILATYFFSRRYRGEGPAIIAALILAANLFYVGVCRYLVIDSVFSFFVVAALFSFYIGVREHRQGFIVLFYGLSALAFLTKGIVAVAIPIFIVPTYFLWTRSLKKNAGFALPLAGIALFFVIAVPWFVVISLREPVFLKSFFWHEHIARFVSKNFEHQEPWYFYLMLLPAIFFPWVFFVKPLKHCWNALRRPSSEYDQYLVCAFLGVLFFYSTSRSKLATYLLPALPFGALLLGDAWANWTSSRSRKIEKSSAVAAGLTVTLITASIFALCAPFFSPGLFNRLPVDGMSVLRVGLIFLIVASIALIVFLLKRQKKAIFAVLVFLALSGSFTGVYLAEALNPNYTTRPLAFGLAPRLSAEDTIFVYGQPGAFYDFPFYLNRSVKMVGLNGEFEFKNADSSKADDRGRAYVDREQWMAAAVGKPAYTLLRASDYSGLEEGVRRHLHVVARDERKVLVVGTPSLAA